MLVVVHVLDYIELLLMLLSHVRKFLFYFLISTDELLLHISLCKQISICRSADKNSLQHSIDHFLLLYSTTSCYIEHTRSIIAFITVLCQAYTIFQLHVPNMLFYGCCAQYTFRPVLKVFALMHCRADISFIFIEIFMQCFTLYIT